jgi:hypothetical protein
MRLSRTARQVLIFPVLTGSSDKVCIKETSSYKQAPLRCETIESEPLD